MSKNMRTADGGLKAKILELLDEHRIATVATTRPDGWPQATMVGYVHNDLDIYFSVGRNSQKLANIEHDSRVSIAIGHDGPTAIRGLSMAAVVEEVSDFGEIAHLNAWISERYPGLKVFAPRETLCAVMRARPTVVSVIDLAKGPGRPELVEVVSETAVYRATGS